MADRMATELYSHEGKYRAIVREVPSKEDDGYVFYVDVLDETFESQRKAIRKARSWLKKKRQKYYQKHPRKWVKRTRGIPKESRNVKINPFKKIHKLYKMKKEVAKLLNKHSDKKLKIHKDYSKKTWKSRKVCAVSGETKDFNLAIASIMKSGTLKERKATAKMIAKIANEQFQKSNLFY